MRSSAVGMGMAIAVVLWARMAGAQGPTEAEAVWGEPFGVGRIALHLPKEALPEVLGAEGLSVSGEHGRVLYPVIETPPDARFVTDLLMQTPLMRGGPVREAAGGLLQDLLALPPRITIYFLFRGAEPLRVTLQSRRPHVFNLMPVPASAAYNRLLAQWWLQYAAQQTGFFQAKKADYPPVVKNYLQTMLARRMNLRLPTAMEPGSWRAQLEHGVGLTLGTEAIRIAIQRERMLGGGSIGEPASLPLPEPPAAIDLALPEPPADVKIEPLAMRVPVECLYVRFGSFANFLWMQDTLAKWGGDLSNLVALRGLDRETTPRIQRQIILKQDALARMFGGTLIADVAIVANDMFQREGAAFGVLFYARNGMLLAADLRNRRSQRIKEGDVSEETIQLDGQKVSYISSPDGTVRSFMAVDGDYVLVTNCKEMARRFLQTKGGNGALGTSKEFRHARAMMPLDRNDTVFAYLSDAFFRNVTGPHYRVEMVRRLQAAADLELVEMAMLASATENEPGETIEELVGGGFLPPEFGRRGDDSRAVIEESRVIDSLRGQRGTFVPIPDVPVEGITPAEARGYGRFLDFYRSQWGGRMDPVIVGMQRKSVSDKLQHVVVDLHASPFAREHVEMLSHWIGQADSARLAPIPGDLIAWEIQLTNQRLFGGIRDVGPPFEIVDGRFVPAGGILNALVGYVGTTGELGFLSLLDRRIRGAPDLRGYAGVPGGLWRHQDDRFTVFSLQREVLDAVVPQLRFEQAERPAQLRLRAGDVSRARLTPTLNALGYLRTRQTTLGNLRLLHAIDQQLHVPGPDCLSAAEVILDAKLICPLGGQYEYRDRPDGSGYWTSTALETFGPADFFHVRVPEGKESPPLNWLRGLSLDATMTANRLSGHAEIDMKLPEKPLTPTESKPELIPTPSPQGGPAE